MQMNATDSMKTRGEKDKDEHKLLTESAPRVLPSDHCIAIRHNSRIPGMKAKYQLKILRTPQYYLIIQHEDLEKGILKKILGDSFHVGGMWKPKVRLL